MCLIDAFVHSIRTACYMLCCNYAMFQNEDTGNATENIPKSFERAGDDKNIVVMEEFSRSHRSHRNSNHDIDSIEMTEEHLTTIMFEEDFMVLKNELQKSNGVEIQTEFAEDVVQRTRSNTFPAKLGVEYKKSFKNKGGKVGYRRHSIGKGDTPEGQGSTNWLRRKLSLSMPRIRGRFLVFLPHIKGLIDDDNA